MNRFPTYLSWNDLNNFPSFIFVHKSSSSGVKQFFFIVFTNTLFL